MPERHQLSDIQSWMQAVITHPSGVNAGIASETATKTIEIGIDDIERLILPSNEMSSLDRIQIYGRAYFGRLVECLRAQFPAVRHAISDEAFDGLAYGYLIQNPSRNYTLGTLGDSFDTFLETTRPARSEGSDEDDLDIADFLIDLSRLERTYSDVFNGQGPEGQVWLRPEDLEGMTVEQFARCHLIPYECVRLLEFRFPVHEYASAIRQGIEPVPPVPRPVLLVVTRRDYVVRRYEINRQQFDLLSSLVRRDSIGEALESLVSNFESDLPSLTAAVRSWFREWSAAPLFSEVIPGYESK